LIYSIGNLSTLAIGAVIVEDTAKILSTMEQITLAFNYVIGLVADLIILISGLQSDPGVKDRIEIVVKTVGAVVTAYGALQFAKRFLHKRTGWPKIVEELFIPRHASDVFRHFHKVQSAMRAAVTTEARERARLAEFKSRTDLIRISAGEVIVGPKATADFDTQQETQTIAQWERYFFQQAEEELREFTKAVDTTRQRITDALSGFSRV